MKCFVCPLYNSNEDCKHSFEKGKGSKEHVLLESLGGKLTSKSLLCKKMNSVFGTEYDSEVSSQLGGLRKMMGVTSRNQIKSIELVDLEGNRRPLTPFDYKPLHTIDIDKGDKVITLTFNTEEEFDKKMKELKESGKFKMVGKPETKKFIRQFSNQHSKGENLTFVINKNYLLHFLKVGIEFYLLKGFPIEDIQGSIDDLKKEKVVDKEGRYPRVFEYHPNLYHYQPKDEEISHFIHLRIDGKNGLIYCVIEYFNFTRTVVILNDNYKGELDETINYCYDLNSNKEVEIDKNEIDFGFNNFNLREFRYLYSEKNVPNHSKRFNNVWERIGNKLVKRGLLERMVDNPLFNSESNQN